MSESPRRAYRALARALAVEAGSARPCYICGDPYVPAAESYLVCGACYTRMRRVLTHRDVLIGVGLKVLAGELRAVTSPVDPDA